MVRYVDSTRSACHVLPFLLVTSENDILVFKPGWPSVASCYLTRVPEFCYYTELLGLSYFVLPPG